MKQINWEKINKFLLYWDGYTETLKKKYDKLQDCRCNRACEWKYTNDDWGTYESSCGEEWVIPNEYGRKANNFYYCPNCGGKIKEVGSEND